MIATIIRNPLEAANFATALKSPFFRLYSVNESLRRSGSYLEAFRELATLADVVAISTSFAGEIFVMFWINLFIDQ